MPYAPEYYANGDGQNGQYPDWQQVYEQSWPSPAPQQQQTQYQQQQQHRYHHHQNAPRQDSRHQYQQFAQNHQNAYGQAPNVGIHDGPAHLPYQQPWQSTPPLLGNSQGYSQQQRERRQHQTQNNPFQYRQGLDYSQHAQDPVNYQSQPNFSHVQQSYQPQHFPSTPQAFSSTQAPESGQVFQATANHYRAPNPDYAHSPQLRQDFQQPTRIMTPNTVHPQQPPSPDTIVVGPRRVEKVQIPVPRDMNLLKQDFDYPADAYVKTMAPDTKTPSHRKQQSPNMPSVKVKQPSKTSGSTPRESPVMSAPRQTTSTSTTKRRKSNNGLAVTPEGGTIGITPQKPSRLPFGPQSSKAEPKHEDDATNQQLLLHLSNEYVESAYALIQNCAGSIMDEAEVERYYDLMATAMGCLESILKNFRLQDPRQEARIRMQLAGLMFQETESDMEVEEILSKGITLCERGRLVDLKYGMQHLLVRTIFKTKPKAAFKAIEKIQHEVEALKLEHWAYAFRLLSVSLACQRGGTADNTLSLKNLSSLTQMADQNRSPGVQTIAALLEATIHLRSNSEDAMDMAQRSLASARTHQLDPVMQQMPQAPVMLNTLDLACSLLTCSPKEAAAKLDTLQKQLDPISKNSNWAANGNFTVPLGVSGNAEIELDSAGIFTSLADGSYALSMRWISKTSIYSLGFLLSGIVALHKTMDQKHAIDHFHQAIKCTQMKRDTDLRPLSAIADSSEDLLKFTSIIRLHLVFGYCACAKWTQASELLKQVSKSVITSQRESEQLIICLLQYLKGVCKQGSGDLQGALHEYNAPLLQFVAKGKGSSHIEDIQALSTLNKVLVMRSIQGQQPEADKLLSLVESYCTSHDNKSFGSAFHIIKATTPESGMPIVKVKQQIQLALSSAQSVSNNQILCIIMNTMTLLFFKDIVGQQALKCGIAGRTFASKIQDPLWKVVADSMYGDTLERCGELDKAAQTKADGEAAWSKVPPGVKQQLLGKGVG